MKRCAGLVGVVVAALMCVLAESAPAVRPVPSYTAVALVPPADAADGFYGTELADVGDLDSDGFGDIAVSGATPPGPNAQQTGRVWLFSGRTRELIREIHSPESRPGDFFGSSIAGIGDVSGDGVADLVIAAAALNVRAGTSGGAVSTAPCVTAELNCNEAQGRAYVFDGKTGVLLRRIESPAQGEYAYFGVTALSMGDLNGDGFGDVVEGTWERQVCDHDKSPATPPRLCGFVGAAYTISGKDGSMLHRFGDPDPPAEYAFFGNGISNPGDVTGDGADDLVFGAPRTSPQAAYLFSGKTGLLVRRIAPPAGVEQGASFGFGEGSGVEPGDVDGDGIRDLIVPAPGQSGGRMYLLSGVDGALIRVLAEPVAGGLFGHWHASAGDLNADGTPDVIGARGLPGPSGFDTPAPSGPAYVFDGATGAVLVALPGLTPYGPAGDLASPGDLDGDAYPDYVLRESLGQSAPGVVFELSGPPGYIPPPRPPAPAPPPPAPPPPPPLPASLAPAAKADRTRPIISDLRVSPPRFAIGSLSRRPRQIGTTIRFVLSERARVRLTFARRRARSVRAKGCRGPSPSARGRRACARYVAIYPSIDVAAARAGLNEVTFRGRLATGRVLRPGRYRLTVTAADAAGNRGTPKHAQLIITAR